MSESSAATTSTRRTAPAVTAPNGEGGIGPALNRQDKLFSHLNEAYIRNVLTVGGRYVCGNPLSVMPVWSDKGNPPGPLNYRQIDELIAFLLRPTTTPTSSATTTCSIPKMTP